MSYTTETTNLKGSASYHHVPTMPDLVGNMGQTLVFAHDEEDEVWPVAEDTADHAWTNVSWEVSIP